MSRYRHKITLDDGTQQSINNSMLTEDDADVQIGFKFKQWSVGSNDSYFPCMETVGKVPAGVYDIQSDPNGNIFLKKKKYVLNDSVLELPMDEVNEIINDIERFWTLKDQFQKYKLVHKRGILLHGPPGSGKSFLLQLLISRLIKRDGIVLSLASVDDVRMFVSFISSIRLIEPKRPIIVMMEDIDNLMDGSNVLSNLLNILDGIDQIDNIVYIATTNYPERLQDRIKNRPSRFDRSYHIDVPNEEVRRFYIKNKLKAEDLKKIDVNEWVKKTNGLSIAHIKEIIISVAILGKNLDDVLLHFEGMKKPKSSRSANPALGFKSDR